jgi:hypothetical protein
MIPEKAALISNTSSPHSRRKETFFGCLSVENVIYKRLEITLNISYFDVNSKTPS